MRTTIVVATTLAAFGLGATHAAAEGGEGNGDPFPFRAPVAAVSVAYVPWAQNAGSPQYPAVATPTLAEGTLPGNGENGRVETANSVPLNATAGTPAYLQAQTTDGGLEQKASRSLQPIPAMAQVDLDGPHPLDGYAPNPGIVDSPGHQHHSRPAHPREFAHAATHRHYASIHRATSRMAFHFNRHPASLGSGTQQASLQVTPYTPWWDDVPQEPTAQ